MSNQQKRLHSIAVAADQLGVGRSTVYVLMNEGKLRSVKVGARRLIPAAAIDEFIERAEQGAA
ncbi:ethanolamine utilization protein EutA [Nocardia mangyaensis]|uniref:Ethanolamine utilization protein EutA n=1 Tax=Nocardia mangyaensis TaxID=2213200 RepID=A0A1J0VV65_9NOCA|nr:helix-turn-helix domain-containing protein [Nocardia mangyaensis]APE35918.1 ethanolamine utilization protein EutA [Nocardia mangyaensis]